MKRPAIRGYRAWGAAGLAALGMLLLSGAAGETSGGETAQLPPLRMMAVARGNLALTVRATGTIEPEEVVDVGAQVAGVIVGFGVEPGSKDKPIDYGSAVEAGTVLAKIDEGPYTAQVKQARADVKLAEAQLAQERAQLKLSEYDRQAASTRGVESPARNLLQQQVSLAAVSVAESVVAQKKVALDLAVQNLAYTAIRSPIKGVVIDRRVNVGQTVVSALSAPSLFLLASDLRKLQVWVQVNEADIARIHKDQPAQFTVDAFPGLTFEGKVQQVRLNAQMTQNVVTYTVVVTADNSSGKLLPYLTADVRLDVEQRKGVLVVPNAALRWKPQPNWIAPGARTGAPGKAQCRLWVREGDRVRPIIVQVGGSDGTMTEITGGDVQEGTAVIVGTAG